MSNLIAELKEELVKYYASVRSEIDLQSQLTLIERGKQGLDNSTIEKIYIDDFIVSLASIEDRSMQKLNNFILKESANIVELMNKEDILLKSSIESVVYISRTVFYGCIVKYRSQDLINKHLLGLFIHSPFYLNENQSNYLRCQLQTSQTENVKIVLDKDLIKLKLACEGVLFNENGGFIFTYFCRLKDIKSNDLKSVKVLEIDASKMDLVEEDCFKGLENLEELCLYDKLKLKHLSSKQFDGLTCLKHLVVYNCGIETIDPDCFGSLNQLETLELSYNCVKQLRTNQFKGLCSVKRIGLYDCEIEFIDRGCFEGLLRLEELYLQRNSIVSLDVNLFVGLRELKKLEISCNQVVSHNGNEISQDEFKLVLNRMPNKAIEILLVS